MEIDSYLPDLEEEIGEILNIKEFNPGVYCIDALREEDFLREYFVVLDTAHMAKKVQAYGKKMDGFRLFANEDDSSGWQIVQYEVSKYNIAVEGKSVPESVFRDASLHAMELYPEYFGTFPVPFHTPHGYTLRYRTLSNGIYWLETSEGKELLAVCYPIWNAELSPTAAICGKTLEYDKVADGERATPYRFFPKKFSCIPIYELMAVRGEWDGTVIHRPALMNAIWESMPSYAMRVNGQQPTKGKFIFLNACEAAGLEIMPKPDGKHIIGMYPEEGTDFLLLK